jgi:lipopolysaccharide export system permease protein
MINKIVIKYLVKENLYSFILVFSFSCLLFISIDLIELIRRSSTKEIEFSILLKMAFLHIPTLFPIILPTVFLLSSMHTYMKLNKNNELTVLRASGFSIWVLITPTVANTLVISIFYIFVFNPIFAFMNVKFKNYESNFFKGSYGLFSISETGLWLREKNENFEYVINAQHYSFENNTLKNVKIFKYDHNNKFKERIDVENVRMINDQYWELTNGFKLEINKTPSAFSKDQIDINLDAEKIEKNFRPPDTISFWSLNEYIKNLESSGFSIKKHVIYKNYLFSFPLILISMVLLGCLLSIKKERVKKNAIKIIYGLIIGLIFHFTSDVVKTLGQSSDLNIFLTVWAAPLIFIFLLISTLIHLEDG